MKPANEHRRLPKTSLNLWIPGRPVPYTRTRGAGGRRYQAPSYRTWRTAAAQHLAIARGATIDGPAAVRIQIGPAGIVAGFAAAGESLRGGLRGDIDNYIKAVLDAATDAEVITDDRLIQTIEAGFAPTRQPTT